MEYKCWLTNEITDLDDREPDYEVKGTYGGGAAEWAAKRHATDQVVDEDCNITAIVKGPGGLIED